MSLLIGRRFTDPGGEYGGYRAFDGIIDEVRISNTIRSAAWIAAAYENHSASESFYSMGDQESIPGIPVVSNPDPANGATGVSVSLTQLSFTLTDPDGDLMDYTVTTSPDIGSASGSGVSSGTYSVAVSSLAYDTTYTWNVHATDGVNPVDTTFSFTTTAAPAAWWDTDWPYRKKIIINAARVASDLTAFPALIDITDSDLSLHAQANGNDLAFTDSIGNKLNHEIETYENTAGHLVAWVSTNLSASVDTVLYLYYGNASAPAQQNREAVWDAGYAMVQHLAEESGTDYDSTVNNNDGTPENGVVQGAAGKANGADVFDGVDDSVNCGSSDSLDNLNPVTVEACICPASQRQLNGGRVFDKERRLLFVDGFDVPPPRQCLDFTQSFSTTSGIWRTPVNSIQTGQWYHVAVAYDSTSAGNDPMIYIKRQSADTYRSTDSGGFCRKRCRQCPVNRQAVYRSRRRVCWVPGF